MKDLSSNQFIGWNSIIGERGGQAIGRTRKFPSNLAAKLARSVIVDGQIRFVLDSYINNLSCRLLGHVPR